MAKHTVSAYNGRMKDEIITAQALKEKIDADAGGYMLVDTLKRESYEARHVPTAVNVPEGPDFVRDFEAAVQVPKDAAIIVYCSSETCVRHIRAAAALRSAGYAGVVRFAGGLAGWQEAGFDFES